MHRAHVREGLRAALPLALAAFLFSAAFGVLAVDAGLGRLGAVAMSATTFAGSAQFAAATILDDGGGAAAAIVAALLLNARYVPLSLGVASIFPGRRRRRLLESQLIVDESWALAGRSGRFEYGVLVGAGVLLYVVWVGGTALGTVAGDVLDPEAVGLDAAFPALFLALLDVQFVTRLTPFLETFETAESLDDALRANARLMAETARQEPLWAPLLVEFWTHASRDPVLRAEAATRHERVLDIIGEAIAGIAERFGIAWSRPPRELVRAASAFARGMALERLLDPDAVAVQTFEEDFLRFVKSHVRPADQEGGAP